MLNFSLGQRKSTTLLVALASEGCRYRLPRACHFSHTYVAFPDSRCVLPSWFEQGRKLLRIDFDTSAGDETYTTLKSSLEMAKQLTKLLAEEVICGKEGTIKAGG